MFSRRLHWDLTPNAISQLVAARRAAGQPFLDLTNSNPTRAGFVFDDNLLAALTDPRALVYEPTAQGLLATREAVAGYYAEHGVTVDPADIFLTASTSEAYSYVFKLLTDPGDEVLVPQPSYPLFDFLATMDNVEVHQYPAETTDITPWRSTRTRALVAVHPNNPTGQAASRQLASFCAEQGLPLIVDEVFLDYHWNERTQLASLPSRTDGAVDRARQSTNERTQLASLASRTDGAVDRARQGTNERTQLASLASRTHGAVDRAPQGTNERTQLASLASRTVDGVPEGVLASFASKAEHPTFILSGLSKVCALPQMKLGWIVVCGPPADRRRIAERLELIADTYLSASAPIQLAAPFWLANRHGIQEQIRARCRANLARLDASGLKRQASSVGGWTVVIELPPGTDEERLVLKLFEQDSVLLQPGYFYDFSGPPVVVASLLTPPEEFSQALTCLAGRA